MDASFDSFISPDNFMDAYRKMSKGKSSKKEFILWDIDHEKHINNVRQALLDDT